MCKMRTHWKRSRHPAICGYRHVRDDTHGAQGGRAGKLACEENRQGFRSFVRAFDCNRGTGDLDAPSVEMAPAIAPDGSWHHSWRL
jgi:hypothetical protein